MKITLKRNSWHRRLQRYVLRINPYQDFPNLCPYFWLTVFCLLVVPFVAGWRGLRKAVLFSLEWFFAGIEFLVKLIAKPIEEYICKPLDNYYVENYIKKLPPDTLVKYLNSRKQKDRRIFVRWRTAMQEEKKDPIALITKFEYDYYARRNALEAEEKAAERIREEQAAKEWEEQRKREQARQQRLMKLARWTQKFFPLVVLALIFPILYWLAGLGIELLHWFDHVVVPWGKVWQYTKVVLKVLGIVLAAGLSFAGGVLFLSLFFNHVFKKCWITLTIPFQTPAAQAAGRKIGRGLYFVLRPVGLLFVLVAGAIIEVGSFFVAYLKAAKGDYCPEIEWKE